MHDNYAPDFAASCAMVPSPAATAQPAYALVEIFGHRSHYGEIREVEAFGAKLLEVMDVDTSKTHRYGGASIFSLTMLSQSEMDAHIASVKRQKQREADYAADYEKRRLAREAAADTEEEEDDGGPS